MRSMVRGFLIGLPLPFTFLLIDGLLHGRALGWAVYGGVLLALPSAIIGAVVGAVWGILFEREEEE